MDDLDLRSATPADLVRRGVRLLGWHRRAVAAALTGVAVLCGLSVVRPHAVATRAVWVAARDLAGGQPLLAIDVSLRRLPTADVPSEALASSDRVIGRLVAAPMRRGEPMTDVRLLEPGLLEALGRPGLVAVPVRLADGAAASALVHAGDTVDILATDPDGRGAQAPRTVASAVIVLAVPGRDDAAADGAAGLVVVAATSAQATALAQAGGGSRLSIVLQRR